MSLEFDFSIIDAATRRKLKTHQIGDRRYVGVEPGQTFGILVQSHTATRLGVSLSVGGVDIATGQPAVLQEGGHFIIAPNSSGEFLTWRQTQNGGAALVFTEQALAVSSFRVTPDMGLPPNLISVAAWAETPRYAASHAPLFYDPAPLYRGSALEGHVELTSASKSAGGVTRGLGVGAGEYQEQRFETTSALRQPRSLGVKGIWFMPWADLRQELERLAPPQIPTGFLNGPGPRGADLSGVPRVGGGQASEIPSRFSRYE